MNDAGCAEASGKLTQPYPAARRGVRVIAVSLIASFLYFGSYIVVAVSHLSVTIISSACRESFSDDVLWGSSAVRFIFFDEAGTSEHEPVTVHVGIIVNADKQLMMAERAVEEVLGAVPEQYQADFVFHAKEVWGSSKYRDGWPMADRLGLIRAMCSLPAKLSLPVTMGKVRRNSSVGDDVLKGGCARMAGPKPPDLSKAQFQHVFAFQATIATADRYIRNYADPGEVATVVAEDVPEMRRFLEDAPSRYRDRPVNIQGEILQTEKEKNQGYVEQSSDFRVTRIRRTVHFVRKGGDSLLQVADACAFAFRRYFSNQEFGEEFAQLVAGEPLVKSDFDGPCSFMLFYDHPRTI